MPAYKRLGLWLIWSVLLEGFYHEAILSSHDLRLCASVLQQAETRLSVRKQSRNHRTRIRGGAKRKNQGRDEHRGDDAGGATAEWRHCHSCGEDSDDAAPPRPRYRATGGQRHRTHSSARARSSTGGTS